MWAFFITEMPEVIMKEFFKTLFKVFEYLYSDKTEQETVVKTDPVVVVKVDPIVEPTPVIPKACNIKAFLDMIAQAEGTYGRGDNGYNIIVGGKIFSDYSDHPNVLVDLPKLGIKSSAAGRYQILNRYWKHYKRELKLPDFSPESQDKYAINQIKERRALSDVENGRIISAIEKCKNIWASFPSAGYGQKEISLNLMLTYYLTSGGKLCEKDMEIYKK